MDSLQALSPAQWCQTFFVLCAGVVISLQLLPPEVRRTMLDYGARRTTRAGVRDDTARRSNVLNRIAEQVTSYGQVPHQWFLHFYITSTLLSAFWAWQYVSQGSMMRELAVRQSRSGQPSIELGQVFAAWLMMALQGSRRLYESLYVSKQGKSPMWFVHWALGLLFYSLMSISVWIEGSGAILASWNSPREFRFPDGRVTVAVALYAFACTKQSECHRYLASLEKYTLPSQGWFQYIVCPHYTSECLLYVAISHAAAPPGRLLNSTILCGLFFIVANLGATAHGTKKWYAEKFGADSVANKWKMIPPVF